MIKAGETTNAKKEMRFFLANSTTPTTGVTGHTFSGSEITVCPPAASSFTAFAGTVLELGGGHYAYRPSAGELASGGNQITARINVSGAVPISIGDDVVAFDPQAVANLGLTDLDATISSVNTAVASVQTDTTNIKTRLPTALDGSGNMKAGVQSIVNNAITSSAIASGAITAAAFAANAIASAAIAAGAITTTAFADGAITNAKIADGLLSVAKLVDGLITSAKIAANAIGATQIASSAITSSKFAAGAITSTVLATDSITTSQLADGTLATSKFPDGAITSAKIADALLTTAKFADGAITSAKLASSATSAIRDAMLAGVVDGTRTVKGALARLHAFFAGKATGLDSSTATFYLQDGVTKAMEFTQDTSAGTRVAASTVNGD